MCVRKKVGRVDVKRSCHGYDVISSDMTYDYPGLVTLWKKSDVLFSRDMLVGIPNVPYQLETSDEFVRCNGANLFQTIIF